MSIPSALYVGMVMHRRLKPRVHRFRYRTFWMLLDLDELPLLNRRLRLFSLNRFNLFSFHERDHGTADGTPLRRHVEKHLAAAGLDLGGGAIRLFCMPRVLGYGFNPLSIYFCHHRTGALAALLYEVHNTFGERHSYLIPVDPAQHGAIRQSSEKCFYVSPFMDMALSYTFRVVAPEARVSVAIRSADAEGDVLIAALSGQRKPLTDARLMIAFIGHPLLTLKVIGAIHWEALRLVLKGIRPRARPPAPEWPVTIVSSGSPTDVV